MPPSQTRPPTAGPAHVCKRLLRRISSSHEVVTIHGGAVFHS
uniref:Uncharacterized protein n=1 Tax=Arundo donax TaxID=35708 RepID=A0A0A8Y344_ARUDO